MEENTVNKDFSTNVTGWLFISGALMLWLGWIIMPVHIGAYFEPGNFSAIKEHLYLWIWMYRIHIFGYIICVMALIALGSLLTESRVRVLAWPGIAVASIGLVVSVLATAFYYHHGAWGALQTEGQSPETIRLFVESLRTDTEYVTCLIRFGRVFLGLGLVVLALGFLKWKVFPLLISAPAILLGLAGMALSMGFPNNLEYYVPVFHLNSAWLLTMGIVTLRKGVNLNFE